MRDYSVPIVTYLVEIDYAGERLRGRVFLPAHSDPREDEARLEDWLNGPGRFFPFLPEGARETVLLNKASITTLSLPAGAAAAQAAVELEEEGEAGDDRAGGSATAGRAGGHEEAALAVVVEHGGGRTDGQVRIDMPAARQRLLDVLNQHEPFLALRSEGRLVLVRKRSITRIQEAEGLR